MRPRSDPFEPELAKPRCDSTTTSPISSFWRVCQVEAALLRCPGVAAAAVAPLPDPRLGEAGNPQRAEATHPLSSRMKAGLFCRTGGRSSAGSPSWLGVGRALVRRAGGRRSRCAYRSPNAFCQPAAWRGAGAAQRSHVRKGTACSVAGRSARPLPGLRACGLQGAASCGRMWCVTQ